MSRAPQRRTLMTRAKLLDAARSLVSEGGYEALRIEEIVLKAGVAKGTFFSHFADKDVLMDLLIGEELDRIIDVIEAGASPKNADGVAEALLPLAAFMTSERYVFDVTLRYSGAAGVEEIGPIATNFGRQVALMIGWCSKAGTNFRTDVDSELLAEGIHAFFLQAMAMNFCALHNAGSVTDRLKPYLRAWLSPAC